MKKKKQQKFDLLEPDNKEWKKKRKKTQKDAHFALKYW